MSLINFFFFLFREDIPEEIISGNKDNIILGNAIPKNLDLFTTVCNALCASVNNPRNGKILLFQYSVYLLA